MTPVAFFRKPLTGNGGVFPMRTSGTTDMVMGTATQVFGKAMRGIGEMVGSERLKREGVVQEAKGEAQKTMGKVKAAAGPTAQH